jgi:DNA helicase-2/ATP-dependent DNA helicase PcrA
VANSVIAHNQDRIPKDLFTQKPKDRIAVHHHAKSEKDESDWIAKQIATLTKKGCKNSDIAILFRAAFQSREIEQALLRKHIKYVVWGGIRFFERKEIKDALAYLRLVAYQDDLSFVRVINTPSRKFGKAKLARLQTLAKQEGTSLYATLKKHLRDKEFDKEAFAKFIELIEDCIKAKDNTKTSDMLEYLLQESGLKDLLREDEDEDRLENIQELASSILHYEKVNINEEISLDTYLQDIALYTNDDHRKDTPTLKLMTIHQAKGLEFPYVFITGLSEGIFPNMRSIREGKKNGEEEERRLMYVAITRAEKALFLTESEGFNISSKTNKYPSRFLAEIKPDLVVTEGVVPEELWKGTRNLTHVLDQEDFSAERAAYASPFHVGDIVRHAVFGEGVIVSANKDFTSFDVQFDSGAIRTLRAGFIQLADLP